MQLSPVALSRFFKKVTHTVVPCVRLGTSSMTTGELVWHWQKVFEANGVPEARESSEIIISHALGVKMFHSLPPCWAQQPVSADQMKRIDIMGEERLKRVPLQYIIEEWDFLDMTLRMRPPVFIPRPETEELVGVTLSGCSALQSSPDPVILEVGCGSGAVSLALLRKLPQARVIAVDKTEAAVSLTKENAERLGLHQRIRIIQHDILTEAPNRLLEWGSVDVVVSNPPYIFTSDMSQLDPEIIKYEDHTALDGGSDGMDVIRGILLLAPDLLKQKGDIFLEGDPRHPDMVRQWLQNCSREKLQLINVVRDFCNNVDL
ncbi:MTRF1L release factor glutamine methyltransferase isoform X2 [Bombina bombina]|uniref:MTRF1L release factor glutamine methyltransferase isoform X2 n=1 Tax=Bombina bombina TaxID=8345 RepID=UPI00235B13E0|nr:MTRF1L release factor glutamine methyltransferase isoform X2 [Bombina bombina]